MGNPTSPDRSTRRGIAVDQSYPTTFEATEMEYLKEGVRCIPCLTEGKGHCDSHNGNTTVVLLSTGYHNKIKSVLSDLVYRRLAMDQLAKLRDKLRPS